MAHLMSSTYGNVATSIITYSTILGINTQQQSNSSIRTRIKVISACHSLLVTCLTVTSLSQDWKSLNQAEKTGSILKHDNSHAASTLDDSQNPLISGRNTLANFVTAWEAGYLIYDTLALLVECYLKDRTRGLRSALVRLIRGSPIFVVHHVLLASALLWLQTYIAAKKEKGVKVIMAFFLMNASTPLLHLRWYRRKVTGRSDARFDAALAAVFAITRFGSVYWVVRKYAQYHRLGTWDALRRQRTICQAGTGVLTGVNVLWWMALVMQMTGRRQKIRPP